MELVSGPSCSAPLLTTWNVSVGLNDTMIFSAATDEPAGTIGLCLDWNLRKNLTELWECGAVGKTNQEWFASPNNGIGEFQLGGCLCVDTNSRSQSPSASVAPSPSRPPVTQQRISTCTCDGSPDQAWSFPGVQETGPVFHVASERCWALVKDNCGSRFCIDLDVRAKAWLWAPSAASDHSPSSLCSPSSRARRPACFSGTLLRATMGPCSSGSLATRRRKSWGGALIILGRTSKCVRGRGVPIARFCSYSGRAPFCSWSSTRARPETSSR